MSLGWDPLGFINHLGVTDLVWLVVQAVHSIAHPTGVILTPALVSSEMGSIICLQQKPVTLWIHLPVLLKLNS